ncbi:hypothetical protein Tco_1525880 [Tanacetum coccineum]
MLVTYTKECRWEVRTLIKDHTYIQSRTIKACTSRFLADHVIKSLATNPYIPVRAVQDQMQKQFEVGVSKIKAFRVKRIASDIMIDSYREQYSLLREYAQELINQNPGTTVRIDGLTQAISSVFPSAEHMYCVRHIHENMKSQFKGGVYKEMLWNAAKATSKGEFKKKMGELNSFNSDAYDWLMKIPLEQWSRAHFSDRAKCDLLINNICEVFNRQLVDGRDQPIITCLEYIREYLMKRIVVVQKVIAKTIGPLTPSMTKMKWELTGIPCKHDVAAIYNMFENSAGVVVESRTVIIPPLYKPSIGRPPKKRKKSNDEIASQSASSGKLSRKGKSVSCGKCGNVGHNRKGFRGQGGGSSQAGARKVSSQVPGSRKVSGQAAGARNVSGPAAGARNVSGQAVGAKKASS